jgi:predicted nicotinamide N-methyase
MFSFNFLPSDKDTDGGSMKEESQQQSNDSHKAVPTSEDAEFHWLQPTDVKICLEDMTKCFAHLERACQMVILSKQQEDDTSNINSMSYLRQIHEDMVSQQSALHYNRTDLVPGIYEGGLKVWECSMDLCRYLYDHDVTMQGHVLELGCGHGLPSCWVFKMALSRQLEDCWVTLSDYNEFVLTDVTLKNVFLNAKDACSISTEPTLTKWLSEHAALGAGDWNKMSSLLLQPTPQSPDQPQAAPKDGLFDFILAAETTYSETAATETAMLIARHLRPGKGVAYVATKRYYFGVRGGTSCLVDALNRQGSHLDVEVLKEYNNGVGNIRELLLVRSHSP